MTGMTRIDTVSEQPLLVLPRGVIFGVGPIRFIRSLWTNNPPSPTP